MNQMHNFVKVSLLNQESRQKIDIQRSFLFKITNSGAYLFTAQENKNLLQH